MKQFLSAVTRNPISLLGTAITTAAVMLIVTLFILESLGFLGTPYLGILTYVILPSIFVVGLLLIPLGVMRQRRLDRQARERGEKPSTFPVIDLNSDRTRRIVLLFLVLTCANLVILAVTTYKGVEVMDSTEFCGTTCHTLMEPEYTAYQRSPHARVKCASCHIGPGADWFVKSKLSGSWQVVAATFDLYPRPIPTPVHNLRPARETCEQCHWPTKFVGDRLKVITHHESDEANTPLKTVLLLRVGGVQGRAAHGIHWHVDPGIAIRYRADETREQIHEIEMTTPDGKVKTFKTEDHEQQLAASPIAAEWRTMDCIDCHNRPSHIFRMPEEEIDSALAEGRISTELPYVRREGLRLLGEKYDSRAAVPAAVDTALRAFYDKDYPELANGHADQIATAAREIAHIHNSNVFPAMDIDWGTYPNHIGHTTAEGCFRCHDDLHATAEGETISQDCDTCHSLLAMEEEDPAILSDLRP